MKLCLGCVSWVLYSFRQSPVPLERSLKSKSTFYRFYRFFYFSRQRRRRRLVERVRLGLFFRVFFNEYNEIRIQCVCVFFFDQTGTRFEEFPK